MVVGAVAVSVEMAFVGPMIMTEAGEDNGVASTVTVIRVVDVENIVVVGELLSLELKYTIVVLLGATEATGETI